MVHRKKFFLPSLFLLLWLQSAESTEYAPQSFTFDGRAFSNTEATSPLLDNISMRIQILNAAQDCILYEESQSVNTKNSNGYFSIQVGSASTSDKRGSHDSGRSMSEIFANRGTISGVRITDSASCAYTPSPGEKRYVRIQMTSESDGATRTISPNILLDSVPSAIIAERAESLQGLLANQFIQTKTSDSYVLTQSNIESVFTSTNYSRLNSLLASPATNYVQTGSNGSITVPNISGNPTSGLAVGQIWYDSAANTLKYYDGSVRTVGASGATGTVTSVAAGTGLTGGPITSTGTLAVDVGTTTGKIVQVAAGNKLPVIDGSNLTNISAASVDGNVRSQQIDVWDTTNAHRVSIAAPSAAVLTTNYNLTLPGALPAGHGYVLTGDTSGVLDWSPLNNSQWTTSGSDIYYNTGKVGIGTSNPSRILQVDHNSGTWPQSAVNRTLTSTQQFSAVGITENGNRRAWLRYDHINSIAMLSSESAGTQLALGASGVERMRFDSSGNVGVGTSTPGSTLDVKGTLRLSGNTSGYVGFAPAAAAGSTIYTLPSADGSSGQCLQTNGSGTLSWSTPSQWTTAGSNLYLGSGNVGIGSTNANPSYKLTVTSTNQYDGVGVANGTSAVADLKGYAAGNDNGGLSLYNGGSKYIQLLASGTSYLNGGNFGLGTSTPNAPLTIQSASSTTTPHVRIDTPTSAIGDSVYIGLNTNRVGIGYDGSRTSLALTDAPSGTTSHKNITFDTGGSERMRVTSTGNIAMGATTANLKLEINGTGTGPATTGTAQNGALRIGNNGAGVLDIGMISGGVGGWLQATNNTNLGTKYPLLLNPNGGSVGIGTTTPGATLDVVGSGRFYTSDSTTAQMTLLNSSSTAARYPAVAIMNYAGSFGSGHPVVSFGSARGAWGSGTAVQSGDGLGQIDLNTNDGSNTSTVYIAAPLAMYATENHSSTGHGFYTRFATVPNGSTTSVERMRIDSTGYVGIGTMTPNATLQVNGTITGKPSVSNGTSTIDFSTGNYQHTTASCGNFNLNNLKDGGSYTFAVQGATAATCVFSAYSDAGSTALTVHMPPSHGITTASTHTLYNFIVMGTHVYVSWTPGY